MHFTFFGIKFYVGTVWPKAQWIFGFPRICNVQYDTYCILTFKRKTRRTLAYIIIIKLNNLNIGAQHVYRLFVFVLNYNDGLLEPLCQIYGILAPFD